LLEYPLIADRDSFQIALKDGVPIDTKDLPRRLGGNPQMVVFVHDKIDPISSKSSMKTC